VQARRLWRAGQGAFCLWSKRTGPVGSDAAGARGSPPRIRAASDKILIAFHHACDQGDYEVAEELLRILEMMLTRRPVAPDVNRRKNMESLVAAHERLWLLRHPEANEK
jgi:hypothetical protein